MKVANPVPSNASEPGSGTGVAVDSVVSDVEGVDFTTSHDIETSSTALSVKFRSGSIGPPTLQAELPAGVQL